MRRNKLKLIIWSLCTILVVLISIISIIFFNQNNSDKNDQAEQDLCVTLDALLNRTETEKIYMSGMLFSEDSYNIISDNEVGTMISDRTKYKIEEINLENDEGSVKISISLPDVYKILVETVEKDNSFDSTDELLQTVSESLTATYPTIENTIECSIEYKDGHWYINPNEELFNCLSGNLYSYYMDLGQNTINNILGGDSSDE